MARGTLLALAWLAPGWLAPGRPGQSAVSDVGDPPEVPSVASLAGAPAGAVTAPLRFASGRLTVTVMDAEGRALDFLLSTGNATTVLTESTADRLGANPRLTLGPASGAGGGGASGTVALETEGLQTLPDDALAIGGHRFSGIVGSNTLGRYDVLVDAPAGRLVLAPIGPRVEWPGVALSEPIRLRVYHGVALGLDLEVNGTPYLAALDLGTPGLLVNAPAGAALGIESDDVVTVALGAYRLSDAPVRVSDHPLFARWDPAGHGFVLVGSVIAEECVVALSWAHQEMRMCLR